MLATPWEGPFIDDQWVFELKWDGVRCLASVDDQGVHLRSRTGNDMTARYPEIAGGAFPAGLVLDGEIVAFDEAGNPSFDRLQSRMNLPFGARRASVSLVVFDVLHLGEPLIDLPLEERLARLDDLDLPAGCVTGDRFDGDATPVWDFVTARRLEGIVAKRRGSSYRPGMRSPDWRKISNFSQLRAVVGGFTPGTGGRSSTFGALLLGLWVDDGLRWVGSVGSGFSEPTLRAIRAALDEMTIPNSPFIADPELLKPELPKPELLKPVSWVTPQLVAVVRFKQWTRAGRLRAPSFKGFTDHPARSVTWAAEGPGHTE